MTFEAATRSDAWELAGVTWPGRAEKANIRGDFPNPLELRVHFSATVRTIGEIDDPYLLEPCK